MDMRKSNKRKAPRSIDISTGLASRRKCPFQGSCLKTGQHSIFVIIRKIKRTIYVCWIPYLLKIL